MWIIFFKIKEIQKNSHIGLFCLLGMVKLWKINANCKPGTSTFFQWRQPQQPQSQLPLQNQPQLRDLLDHRSAPPLHNVPQPPQPTIIANTASALMEPVYTLGKLVVSTTQARYTSKVAPSSGGRTQPECSKGRGLGGIGRLGDEGIFWKQDQEEVAQSYFCVDLAPQIRGSWKRERSFYSTRKVCSVCLFISFTVSFITVQ